jgi:translation initiation factor IF-2
MTDNNNSGEKKLTVGGSKTLSLKRPIEQGIVKQSFSHGRTKAVVVETVKRRPGGPEPRDVKPVVETKPQPITPPPAPRQEAPAQPPRPPVAQRTLTDDELDARARIAQQEARRREDEQRQRDEAERREREERAAAEARRREAELAAQQAAKAAERAAAPVVSAPAPAPVAPPPAPPSVPTPPPAPVAAAPRPPEAPVRPATYQERPRSDQAPQRDFGQRPPRLEGSNFARNSEGGAPRRSDGGGFRPRGEGGAPPREGGFRDRDGGGQGFRPRGDAPPRDGNREGGFRPRGEGGGPPREGGFRDRDGGGGGFRPRGEGAPPRRDGERPAGGTVRLGFAPRPGQGGPAGGLSARGPGGAPGARPGGPRLGPVGAPAAPEFGDIRPQRQQPGAVVRKPVDFDEDDGAPRKTNIKAPAPGRAEKPKPGMEKARGRLTISSVTSDEDERQRSVAAFKRRVQRMKGHASNEPREKLVREVVLPEAITIQELANRMSERAVDVIRALMKMGQMHKITDTIDADTAQILAEEMGHSVKRVADSDVEEGLFAEIDEGDALVSRPPVVTIMGHVDHGKTSLLDAIRKTNVVKGEAGGITQHIGAYQVVSPLGGKITFIDTPGHAAFTAMRARGARVTDIVILVVAADDGVMPQTIEAINHAKAAKVPMIVAINKIDKPDARPERVRTELLNHDVQVESMGGETLELEVSAKAGTNLEKLLETIQLQAEILDLRANPERAAEGTVIEAKLDRGRGPVATVLVERGTLRQGDIVVAGSEWGRVRALINDQGDQVSSAEPSVPVEILGFNGAPEAGDRLAVVENEARAREITNYRDRLKREKAAARGSSQGRSLVELMKAAKDGAGKKEFPLVIKGDVQGSVEAISASVEKLGNDEVRARVLHAAAGGVTESDITLAQATGSVVVAFNVRAHKEAREAAERAGVEIRYYSIIYDLVDDVKQAMSGLLAPTLRETMMGNAEIRQVFNITKVGNVAGCVVTDGKVERGMGVRLIRDNVVIHEGTLKTLKRFKDEVKEVVAGQECGMAFTNYEDMRAGDVIECFRVEEVKRSL